MKHLARRHPIAVGLLLLVVGPYLLALALAFVVIFVIASVIETVAIEPDGRR
jgi:hypothetical protein